MGNTTFTCNGHTYLLSDALSWQEAQNQAVRLGGNLVTINDAAEQTWLAATFTDIVWIGYTDQTTEGTFQWISGETATLPIGIKVNPMTLMALKITHNNIPMVSGMTSAVIVR